MRYCKDCWNFDRCKAERKTVDFAVDDGVCFAFDGKPMTNADRIRAMTDEELVGLLFSFRIDAYGAADGAPCILPNTMAKIGEWLQQPCEEGE